MAENSTKEVRTGRVVFSVLLALFVITILGAIGLAFLLESGSRSYEAGMSAYYRGDTETALAEFARAIENPFFSKSVAKSTPTWPALISLADLQARTPLTWTPNEQLRIFPGRSNSASRQRTRRTSHAA
jgi:hypothetical protein